MYQRIHVPFVYIVYMLHMPPLPISPPVSGLLLLSIIYASIDRIYTGVERGLKIQMQ